MTPTAIYTTELPPCRDCGGEGGGTVYGTTTAPVASPPESWADCACNASYDDGEYGWQDGPHAGIQRCDGCGGMCGEILPVSRAAYELLGPGQLVYLVGEKIAHSFECALELMAMAMPVVERRAA